MKRKNVWIVLILIFILLMGITSFFIFFPTKTAKNLKIGNNTNSQEIVDYILNISSYETKVEVEVNSNKNKNKYILKQQYVKERISKQEVIEPSNIAGTKIIKDGEQLKIENTKLNLSTIFEKYEYISDNHLDLSCFIEDYKKDEKANWKEENNQIIMMATNNQIKKTLWIDKATGSLTKMEVKGTNKNIEIYILYNEININSLK